MPTDLSKLRVSLTKHGSHKLAYLVWEFPKDEILKHVAGDYHSINIDYAQAQNILSANGEGQPPDLWDQLRQYGQEDVCDIVFIANVFSHVDLIQTMINATHNGCKIERGGVIEDKAYTNFAHTIDRLGYAIEHTTDFVSFDISRIFYKSYLTEYIVEIITIKLLEAGWDRTNSFEDECIRLNLNRVFGLTRVDFSIWVHDSNAIDVIEIAESKARRSFETGIMFRQGHRSKYEGKVERNPSKKQLTLTLHNHIQNRVYELLLHEFPQYEVGTEVPTNSGSIDIVMKGKGKFIFYEIKTENRVRLNIRSAISQLLEYAYWNKIEDVEKLIIIGPNIPTPMAVEYMETIRGKFHIPIYYQYYDMEKLVLEAPV